MAEVALTLKCIMKDGVIGYWAPLPEGVPEADSPRARMLRLLSDPTPAFAAVTDADEREALGNSLALALTRAEYHETRFKSILGSLEARRRQADVPFTSDLLVVYTIYEAGAALGAARLAVDELLHVTARRHGEPDTAQIEKRWAASLVMDDAKFAKATYASVPETLLLRSKL
ncbi:MAG: hypothetical protein IPM79_01220 [Polyangiaceae bacterium]|nr:hypothetical protein [Polyangiaceae bacterium]